jgi:hypothetical protein
MAGQTAFAAMHPQQPAPVNPCPPGQSLHCHNGHDIFCACMPSQPIPPPPPPPPSDGGGEDNGSCGDGWRPATLVAPGSF